MLTNITYKFEFVLKINRKKLQSKKKFTKLQNEAMSKKYEKLKWSMRN